MKFAVKQVLSGRGLLFVAAVAGALAGATATVLAAGDDTRDGPVTARVTAQQAADAALKAVPGGHIEGLEVEYDGRVLLWEADVRAGDGTKRELHIDARDRRLIGNHVDPPEEDAGEACGGTGDGASAQRDEATALRAAKVTAARAARIALATVPGTMTSVDFEQRRTSNLWDVDVAGEDGRDHRLLIHPASGKVMANVVDEDDD